MSARPRPPRRAASTRGSPRELVRQAAIRHGERVAVRSAHAALTYRELAARTTALATALRAAGVREGQQVALALPNSTAYVVWYFGVLEAGAIVVPLAPAIAAAEAGRLLVEGEIGSLVAPDTSPVPAALAMAPAPDDLVAEGARLFRSKAPGVSLAASAWTPDDFMVRQFSSGSTGRPKHMLKTESNVAHDYGHFAEHLGLTEADSFLGAAPFCHAFGSLTFLAACEVGGSVSVLPRFLPAPLLEAARRDRSTVFLATPAMLGFLGTAALPEELSSALADLDWCVCSAGPLGRATHDAFVARFGVTVHVQYGSTETLSATIDLDDGFVEGRVGRPFPGVEVVLLDDEGHPCPAGEPGRVAIRSPAACRGYVGEPALSERTFLGSFVAPGDRGFLDGEGQLHVLGRADVIELGGLKVDPLEIETTIRAALPVRTVVVLPTRRAGLPALRVVVEADPSAVTRAAVVAACRLRLSAHKVPTLVDVRESLPRDANGKVTRRLLGEDD